MMANSVCELPSESRVERGSDYAVIVMSSGERMGYILSFKWRLINKVSQFVMEDWKFVAHSGQLQHVSETRCSADAQPSWFGSLSAWSVHPRPELATSSVTHLFDN